MNQLIAFTGSHSITSVEIIDSAIHCHPRLYGVTRAVVKASTPMCRIFSDTVRAWAAKHAVGVVVVDEPNPATADLEMIDILKRAASRGESVAGLVMPWDVTSRRWSTVFRLARAKIPLFYYTHAEHLETHGLPPEREKRDAERRRAYAKGVKQLAGHRVRGYGG